MTPKAELAIDPEAVRINGFSKIQLVDQKKYRDKTSFTS